MGKHEKVSKCFVQDFGTLSDIHDGAFMQK